MKCDNCELRQAEILQPHTGKRLCRECFLADIQERVGKEAKRLGITSASRVLIAVSGGKDSLVLADTLSRIVDPGKLIAFNIVEGIRGYNREDQVKELNQYLKSLGIELISTSFKASVGYSLDEMVSSSKARGLNIAACTFCGGFRRKLINQAGRDVKADLVATGHNLDDEAQTIIINLLRGDVKKLMRVGESPLKLSDKFVMRVKPLRKIYEWETTMYAYFKGFKFQEVECPYISARPTMRAKVRELMYALEEKSPGFLLRVVENFDRIGEEARRESRLSTLPTCKLCGEPTSFGREYCKNCELLISAGLKSS
ncbi:tRNA-5-methyluridine(54) 2-sulfurtransferase [Metallosphaera sp. J1]|uniref:TIGR00269 family protein n=1 Tax=Metallosphaera javensis (ex Hofmann et al. 2022) TaxID=99938 RepID=UPI001EE06412|nr:TIGR00269 family protein [Metallosphaera javensis (ex Hofmann et al. 2022)]MCG3108682.1 tRNA-5-methyluridine(54) 2-sulfurtransferase [Metallosphaera javensis (ex Hofmann et al. 2022)]